MTEPRLDTAHASRRQFLVLGAAAGAAALVLPKLPALAQGNGDVRALRFLEKLELFQAHFFTNAAISGSNEVLPTNQSSLINTIAKQDLEQARWFRMAQKRYGVVEQLPNSTFSTPRVNPKFNTSSNLFNSPQALITAAVAVKETAVSSFQGQAESANKPELVQALVQLAGIQNRHLALLREAAGQPPFATVTGLTAADTAGRLQKYGFTEEIWK